MSEEKTKRSRGSGLIAALLVLAILVSAGGMGFLGWRVTDLLGQVQRQNAEQKAALKAFDDAMNGRRPEGGGDEGPKPKKKKRLFGD